MRRGINTSIWPLTYAIVAAMDADLDGCSTSLCLASSEWWSPWIHRAAARIASEVARQRTFHQGVHVLQPSTWIKLGRTGGRPVVSPNTISNDSVKFTCQILSYSKLLICLAKEKKRCVSNKLLFSLGKNRG